MDACLFCEIARGKTKTQLIYEDDEVAAFNDIYPKAEVHILVIPKMHIATLNDATSEHQQLLGKLMLCASQIASTHNKLGNGYKLIMNVGKGGGQTVEHIHLHILGGKRLNHETN
jgi:histidine triad (HIT) family protein